MKNFYYRLMIKFKSLFRYQTLCSFSVSSPYKTYWNFDSTQIIFLQDRTTSFIGMIFVKSHNPLFDCEIYEYFKVGSSFPLKLFFTPLLK